MPLRNLYVRIAKNIAEKGFRRKSWFRMRALPVDFPARKGTPSELLGSQKQTSEKCRNNLREVPSKLLRSLQMLYDPQI